MDQTLSFDSPIGVLSVSCTDLGISRVMLANTAPATPVEIAAAPRMLRDAKEQLLQYLQGKRNQFDLPIDWSCTTAFQEAVLKLTLEIPYGEVRTYGQLAQMLNKPSASRAVGTALANSPVWIIIPCHRVISASRDLTGYAGGIPVKQRLLELEGHKIVGQKLA